MRSTVIDYCTLCVIMVANVQTMMSWIDTMIAKENVSTKSTAKPGVSFGKEMSESVLII